MSDLPKPTEEETVRIIEQGTASAFWVRVLLPYLIERANSTMEALLSGKSDDDDVKRGMAKAYKDIATMPARVVQTFVIDQQQREDAAARESENDFRAVYGNRAPFRPANDREAV